MDCYLKFVGGGGGFLKLFILGTLDVIYGY